MKICQNCGTADEVKKNEPGVYPPENCDRCGGLVHEVKMAAWQADAMLAILRRVRLERACVGFTPEQRAAIADRANENAGMLANDTPEIREAMRIYVDTWIAPLIAAIMAGNKRMAGDLSR